MTFATNDSPVSDARTALDAARAVFRAGQATPAPLVWSAAQQLLRVVTGRPALTGQALIGEARRAGLLTLTDAHALIALVSFADRTDRAAESESELAVLREALLALEHAVDMTRTRDAAPPVMSPVSAAPSLAASVTAAATTPVVAASVGTRRAPVGLVIGVSLLVIAVVVGTLAIRAQRRARVYDDAVAAYARGAREVARTAFVSAAQAAPDDARPLVFLGRMSREEGDLPRARRFLTAAVRIAPGSALATRELGSVMLADGQPELARRFYVRAVQVDPTDRVAQGFLGCALLRLNRVDEAQRWFDRAGAGDWSRCVAARPSPIPGASVGTPPFPSPSPR
jgi:tetratricopeptide (TPR) repeat protein